MANSRPNPFWSALALGCALLMAGACQSTEFTYLDVASPDAADDVAPGDTAGEVGAVPTKSLAGGPVRGQHRLLHGNLHLLLDRVPQQDARSVRRVARRARSGAACAAS